MPEGPTIHRLAREHDTLFAGQKLSVLSPQGRFAEPAKLLDGKMLHSVDACGKHLFYYFPGERILHIHLGLYGKFRLHKNPPPDPRGAVRVRITGKTQTIDLNGPNQCEVIDAAETNEILKRLGPDPLRKDALASKAWEHIHASRTPIGMLLMDQSVIAGLGNIYRSEILWLLKIHPKTLGSAITRSQFNTLWRLSKRLMELAVKEGRIITTDAKQWKKPPGKLIRPERFNIYKNPKCPRCKSRITRILMGGRQVFLCGTCQHKAESLSA